MSRAWVATLALTVLAGCTPADPPAWTPTRARSGLRLPLPRLAHVRGRRRSPRAGHLISWRVKSLEGPSAPGWKASPRAWSPSWAAGPATSSGTSRRNGRPPGRGGEPALIVTHTVHVGKQSTPSQVRYWVVRHGQALYLIRAVYPAGREPEEDPGARALLATWRFTPPGSPRPTY